MKPCYNISLMDTVVGLAYLRYAEKIGNFERLFVVIKIFILLAASEDFICFCVYFLSVVDIA